MKGQISLVEAIISAIALFIAFNMMIAPIEYQTKWKESLSSLHGADILITADRLGKLYDYSFSSALKTELLDKLISVKDTIIKTETQGTVKNTIYVACDCTLEQGNYTQNILKDVKFNTRQVTAVVCITTLPTINTCGSGKKYPDVLVIWGYKSLSSVALTDFAKDGNGMIEIADLNVTQASDPAQQTIFGIKWIDLGNFQSQQIQFLKPQDTSTDTYQSYKWYYHLPYNLTLLQDATSFQMESGTTVTCNGKTSSFKFRGNSYQLWACTNNKVYFDTDQPQNGKANTENVTGDIVTISSNKFKINYIDSASKVRVSFKPDYNFNDFLFVDNSHNKIYPFNDDENKIFLSMGYWSLTQTTVSAAILNKFENSLTVWLPDFSRTGLPNTGDDHKQLLASLIFSASNKQTKETFQQVGQITSYINVNNTDILEIYKIDLSIGKPF